MIIAQVHYAATLSIPALLQNKKYRIAVGDILTLLRQSLKPNDVLLFKHIGLQ